MKREQLIFQNMKYFKQGIHKATTNSSNVNSKIYILRFIITSMLKIKTLPSKSNLSLMERIDGKQKASFKEQTCK